MSADGSALVPLNALERRSSGCGAGEAAPVEASSEELRSALARQDLATATELLRLNWLELLRDETRDRVRTALEPLTSAQLTAHPLLAVAVALGFNADSHRRSKAAYYFGLASLGIRLPGNRVSAVDRALVLVAESAALRLSGRTALSVKSARHGLKALESIRDGRAEMIGFLPRIYAQLGTSLYYGGHEAEALRVFERAYAEAGTSSQSSFSSLSMLAGMHALAGNLRECAEYVEVARGEPWSDEQRRLFPGTFYRLAEAVLALERLDATTAQQHLDALTYDPRTTEHWTGIARVQAMTMLVAGRPADGLAELDAITALRSTEAQLPVNRRRLSSIRSLLHVALGNYEAAAAVLDEDGGQEPQSAVDRARLALALDRTSEALTAVRSIAGRPQSPRTRTEALVIEAVIGLRVGYGGRGEAVMQQLVSALRRSGQRLPIHLVPECDLQSLCGALSRAGDGAPLDGRERRSFLLTRPIPSLTPRELDVLGVLSRTASVGDIAAALFVSTNTVKTQLRSIYRKLGVRNRDEALTVAMFHHLISPSPVRTDDGCHTLEG